MRYLAIVLIFWCSSSWASENSLGACKGLAQVAMGAMMGRQQGMPMYQLVDDFSEEMTAAVMPMIRAAYEVDIMPTSELKEQVISDFSDAVFMNCLDQ